MKRRDMLIAAATAAAGGVARAQSYPGKPIQLVVPAAAAGLADLVARVLAATLERILQQPVTVQNRIGAGGLIGTAFVAKAPADGYTLLISLTSHATLPEAEQVRGRAPAYELNQFKAIARVSYEPTLLVASNAAGEQGLKKLVERARKAPMTVSYASTGYYANSHVGIEGFAQAAGLKLIHAPYQGGAQALSAVAGGQVDLTTAGVATAASFAKSGRLRILGVLGNKRIATMPDVPTLRELGYDTDYYVWTGLFAPAATPAPVLDTLRRAMKTASTDPQFKAALEKMETTLDYQDAPEFERFVQAEGQRLGEITRRIGKVGE